MTTKASPDPVLSLQVEYRGESEWLQVDPGTPLAEVALQRVGDRSALIAELGGEAHQLFELELVDPSDPSQSKRLDLSVTVEEMGVWNGAKLRLRLADAYDIELIDEQQKSVQQIVPASLTPSRLVELFAGLGGLDDSSIQSHLVHMRDVSLPGGLRRLDPERSLGELGEVIDALLVLPLPEADIRSRMATKSMKVPVVLVDAAGEVHNWVLPLDRPAAEIERLARSLSGGEPLTELSIELLPDRSESQYRPFVGLGLPGMPGSPEERDVYSGPDKTVYQRLGLIAWPDAGISGRDDQAGWWEIVYPPSTRGRGWMERRQADPIDPEAIPVVKAPRVLDPGHTLWESGVTQDSVSWLQILPGLSLFERLSRMLAGDWQAERLTIRASGLLVRFRHRDGDTGEGLYVRAREDDEQFHFQLPLLQVPPLGRTRGLELFKRLEASASRVAPLRFVLDEEEWLLLAVSIDRASFFDLHEHGVDLLAMMRDAASWQGEIRNWIQSVPDRSPGKRGSNHE